MDEIWKQILGFEGFYEASNLGRIRRNNPVGSAYNGILKPDMLFSLSFIKILMIPLKLYIKL